MKTKFYKNLAKGFISLFCGLMALSMITPEISSEASFTFLEGEASWYSELSPGIRSTTANMEKFDHNDLTCATWNIPFNTVLKITNVRNGKCVFVRVNDRGPAKRFYKKGRVVDLTMAAFHSIEDLDKGIARVRVKIVKSPS
jgi:rare lipoprotein A